MSGDPQAAVERRVAARHLVQRPLACLEHDPDTFRLIRRHEAELDRWFAQRLGYRLHVDSDTARLFKTTALCDNRPLRTAAGRPFHQLEYVLLALVLAATAAGPAVISLRDLVDKVRSAAAEADIPLTGESTERRALVAVLRWMIDQGLADELHAHVDAYAEDSDADAVLKVRPDRIVLLPLPALVGAEDAAALLDRSDRRGVASRQWMRCRLVEDPVLYRDDLTAEEWGELRRRLGEEERILDEMFDLVLEARAEGVAAIDPTGSLAGVRFPRGGTEGHAALLLLDALPGPPVPGEPAPAVAWADVVAAVRRLADEHARRWSKDLVAAPEKLARRVVDLLTEVRLAERVAPEGDDGDAEPGLRLLPASARFRAVAKAQESLW
ncbi:MAG: TIGR02678 family protein [Acidimicrobiales bacterium]